MWNLFVIFLVDQGDVALSTYEASLVPVLFPLDKKVMSRGKINSKDQYRQLLSSSSKCLRIDNRHLFIEEQMRLKRHLTIKDKVFHMDGEFARLEEKLWFQLFGLEKCVFVSLEIFRGQDREPCNYLKLLPCPALPQFDSWGWWWCWLLFFVSPFLSEIGAIISQESPDTVVALKAFFGENELSLSICQVHLEDKLSDHADFSASIKVNK